MSPADALGAALAEMIRTAVRDAIDEKLAELTLPARPAPAMTVAEVAEHTGFSRRAIYDAIAAGELLALRSGRAVRVRPEALTAWLERTELAS